MAAPRKLHAGNWKKGQSGNPSGRPKVNKHIQQLAREKTLEAFKVIIDLMENPETPAAVRKACAQELLDRGYGKPSQHSTTEDLSKVPMEELNAKVREIVLSDERKDGNSEDKDTTH